MKTIELPHTGNLRNRKEASESCYPTGVVSLRRAASEPKLDSGPSRLMSSQCPTAGSMWTSAGLSADCQPTVDRFSVDASADRPAKVHTSPTTADHERCTSHKTLWILTLLVRVPYTHCLVPGRGNILRKNNIISTGIGSLWCIWLVAQALYVARLAPLVVLPSKGRADTHVSPELAPAWPPRNPGTGQFIGRYWHRENTLFFHAVT